MPSRAVDPSLVARLRAPEVVEMPAPHLGLSWRPLTEGDVQAVVDLAVRCADLDHPVTQVNPATVVGALRTEAMVGDSLGGFTAAGHLEAMALVYLAPGDCPVLTASLVASISPRWRGRGIGRALLEWQDGRARQLLAETGHDGHARLAANVEEHLTDRRQLYVAAGFSPKRVIREYRRRAGDPLPDVSLPTDVRVVGWTPELDDGVRTLLDGALDARNPRAAECWTAVHRGLEPAWSAVAVVGDDVVGYAITSRHPDSWAWDHAEGYTELLGIRADRRGQGLDAALLLAVNRALVADDVEYAGLDVDEENESVAAHTVESLGYERRGARIVYTIEI